MNFKILKILNSNSKMTVIVVDIVVVLKISNFRILIFFLKNQSNKKRNSKCKNFEFQFEIDRECGSQCQGVKN